MDRQTIEWIVLPDDIAIVATESGRAWRLSLDNLGESNPFRTEMTGRGSRGSTAALLNEAVAFGFRDDEEDSGAEEISLPQYVYNLIGTYHNARRTPGNYVLAAKQMRELGRPEIASFLETHALEETGHDRLIIKDLNALGLPAEQLVESLIADGVKPLVEMFDSYSSSDFPIGCIGYSYCFEHTAAKKPRSYVEALQALCPPGVDASRFLRTHSCLGSEVEHVEDLVGFIADLPACDRIDIAKAAYHTARRTALLRPQVQKSDEAIIAQISAVAGIEIPLHA
jgi:hypothetical protein